MKNSGNQSALTIYIKYLHTFFVLLVVQTLGGCSGGDHSEPLNDVEWGTVEAVHVSVGMPFSGVFFTATESKESIDAVQDFISASEFELLTDDIPVRVSTGNLTLHLSSGESRSILLFGEDLIQEDAGDYYKVNPDALKALLDYFFDS